MRLEDGVYRLIARVGPAAWLLTHLGNNLSMTKTVDEIWALFAAERLAFLLPGESDEIADLKYTKRVVTAETRQTAHNENSKEVQNALHRQAYVEVIKRAPSFRAAEERILELWKRAGWPKRLPSRSSLYAWKADEANSSDPVLALTAKHGKKGRRKARVDEDVEAMAEEVVRDNYLKRTPRISVRAATGMLRDKVRLANALRPKSDQLRVPCHRVIKRELSNYPEREILAKRYGADMARAMLRVALGGKRPSNVLERAEIDHTPLSMFLLDEDFLPWGRPNLSLALDGAISIPTGIYYGAEPPSNVSLARTVRSSVMPKHELLKRFPEVRHTWPCFGVHAVYVADNAMEEHGAPFKQALSELGGSWIEYCPRKTPWFKGQVERQFRRQDEALHFSLPGNTGTNILTRTDFDPKKDMLLRYSTFEKILMVWLIDICMREKRESLDNMSMVDAWMASVGLADQYVPTRTALLERLFLRRVESRVLDHEGVVFDCLQYNSEAAGALRADLGAVLPVAIWVSDEDVGHIFIEIPGHNTLLRVPCLDQAYSKGLTRWQHTKCKNMRKLKADEGLELSLAEARQRIVDLIKADGEELRSSRRKTRTRFTQKKKATEPEGDVETTDSSPPTSDDAYFRADDAPILSLPVEWRRA